MHDRIREMIAEGRRRLAAKAEAERRAAADAAAKVAAHWQALLAAARQDLGPLAELLGAETVPARFDDRTDSHVFILNVPGVGEVARYYSANTGTWSPSIHRHAHEKWGAPVYGTFFDSREGTRHVIRDEPRSWIWCQTLPEALAQAELQLVRRAELQTQADEANTKRKQQADEKRTATRRPTTADRLLDALNRYIADRIPESV